MIVVAFIGAVQAELLEHNWHSQYIYVNNFYDGWGVPLPTPDHDGYGAGWQIDIAPAGSFPFSAVDEHAGTAAMYGWYDGYGYFIGGFTFTALEGESVVMRVYNAPDKAAATQYFDSLPVMLPDSPDHVPPTPGDFDVTFEFIPEPSSITMIGLVSGCALFVRRFFAV